MRIEEFIIETKKLGLEITEEQLSQLEKFYTLLIEYNQKINLTRIVDKEEVYLKHFYDSLTIFQVEDLTANKILCDVGTGAGFPGIVLKIVFPNLKIVLVDSLQKRVTYLNNIIEQLNLTEIEAVHARAEDFCKENREKFDIVTARAVAELRILLELCIPMVKEKGSFIAMKANITDEVENSKNTMNLLDSRIIEIKEFKLPKENSIRTLIKVQKNSKTNLKYPRSMDKIKKIAL